MSRKRETGNGKQEAGSRERGAGCRKQGSGSKEQEAKSREQGAGSREQEVWIGKGAECGVGDVGQGGQRGKGGQQLRTCHQHSKRSGEGIRSVLTHHILIVTT